MYRIAFVVLGLSLAATAIAVPAAATGSQTCTPDSSFCTTYSLAITDPGTVTAQTHAGAPTDITATLANTSLHHDTDPNVWLSTISLSLLKGLGNNVFTPSAKLDPNLLVAGTSSDCAPDSGNGNSFSGCTGGYGTIYANVSGTGIYDGIHPGTFGIERITNNGGAKAGELDWTATVEYCVSTPAPGGCNLGSPQTQSIPLTANKDAANNGTLTMPATTSFSYGSVSFDASLDSVTALHLLGTSATLADGNPAPHGSQTILHLPTTCGTADVSLSATDKATPPATVTVPLTLGVVGCPTAKLSVSEPKPYTVALNASRSAVGTAGRTLIYHWSFTGGKTKRTTTPRVTHTFKTSKPATIKLAVVDSLGATTKTLTIKLKGSTLTLKTPAKSRSGARVKLSGRLTGWHRKPALRHRTLVLQRCRANRKHCSKVATIHTVAKGKWSRRTSFSKRQPMFVVSFRGGHGYLGTSAHHKVQLRKH